MCFFKSPTVCSGTPFCNINYFNPHGSLMRPAALCHQVGKRGPEKLNNLPEVTPLGSGTVGSKLKLVSFQSLLLEKGPFFCFLCHFIIKQTFFCPLYAK